jgi:ABC-2 type transport system ATP-binding protein
MKKVIEVKGLSKVFTLKSKGKKESKTLTAVDNVNFEIRPGEIIGFIGPNGAGKSTTIKMMTGILYPTSGEVSVCGYNPWEQRKEMTYHIATMFGQKSSLISHLPIIESYRLLGAIYDIPKDVLNERIKEITECFDISHLMDKPASSLSLGQRMICEVAAVTLHRPDVIFFDEPTIGLDIVVKKKVRDMILTLNKKYNTTIFITSHDISDIERSLNKKLGLRIKISQSKQGGGKVVLQYSSTAELDMIIGILDQKKQVELGVKNTVFKDEGVQQQNDKFSIKFVE